MSDGINYEAFAWAPFIDKLVTETLDKHQVGRRPSSPLCTECRIEMRRVNDDLWQCGKCSKVEAL